MEIIVAAECLRRYAVPRWRGLGGGFFLMYRPKISLQFYTNPVIRLQFLCYPVMGLQLYGFFDNSFSIISL